MAAKQGPKPSQPRPPRNAQPDAGWRLFIAIRLPANVRSLVQKLNEELASGGLPLRLVDPDIAHLTLHFLGQTTPERAELLALALTPMASRLRPLELATARLGLFPNDRRPRVVWLGLEGDLAGYRHLHESLGRLLRLQGFEVDSKTPRPHITLGRARDNAPSSFAEDLSAQLSSPSISRILSAAPERFTVSDIELIRSHLEKAGPRYETVKSAELGGRD